MSELGPKQILRSIGHKWPQAWQQVKMFRASKGKDLPDWPDWCYIPLAVGVAIATQGNDARLYQAGLDPVLSPAVVTAAATWRVTQGVYRFDADLYNTLVSQPMDGNLPCDVLKKLPEWCVYIETYGTKLKDITIEGFWAHLEYDVNDNRMELRLVIMSEDGNNIPIPVHLGDWTLEEGIARMQREADEQAEKFFSGVTVPKMDFIRDIVPLVQLVLYLCAENVDMPQAPAHPKTRVRMSGQVDVPRNERYWTVGERIGSTIRKYRNLEEQKEGLSEPTKTPGTHESPRPHMRRAHWHHFWTGPREGERKLILRWLPPIPVNVDDEIDMPVVIHKVD